MRLLRNIALTIVAWLVATLIAAAAIELIAGEPRQGLVPLVTLVILAPTLVFIWRTKR